MIDCMKCAIDFAFLKVSILHAYGVLLGILCRNTKIKTNTNTNTKKKKTKYGTCHWLHLSQSSSARCFFCFPIHSFIPSNSTQLLHCILRSLNRGSELNLFFYINFRDFPIIHLGAPPPLPPTPPKIWQNSLYWYLSANLSGGY